MSFSVSFAKLGRLIQVVIKIVATFLTVLIVQILLHVLSQVLGVDLSGN